MDLQRTPPFALSLGLHGGVVALVLAGASHWTPQSPSVTAPETAESAITYVDITPAPAPPGRSARGPEPHLSFARLSPVRPSLLPLGTADRPLILRTGGVQVTSASLLGQASSLGTNESAGKDKVKRSPGEARVEASQVAELLPGSGNGCPELRRPAHLSSETALEVAVSFVVDSLGRVDPGTIQVVQAPGMPPLKMRFVPHIYALGAAARVDRALPEGAPEFGAIIAEDVLQHVAALRFRPGTRNGLPTRSSVLVACRSEPSG